MRTIVLMLVLLSIFIISVFLGGLTPSDFRDSLYNSFQEKAREILGGNGSPRDLREMLTLPLKIFVNNMIVSLIIYALSPTIVGSTLFYLYQGFMTGAIMSAPSLDRDMVSNIESVFKSCSITQSDLVIIKISFLLPHGIFEIPGITSSLIASLILSKLIVDLIRKRISKPDLVIDLRKRLFESLKYLLYTVVLLLVAAFVEAFITPLIGGLVIGLICFLK
ncbi:MAG: stage II sporulation protein M [Sulfolobales archaeon]